MSILPDGAGSSSEVRRPGPCREVAHFGHRVMSPASRAETVGTRQEIRLEDRLQQVVEGDIKACFDEIDHTALMGRMRRRVGDNRVLGLVKAFLKAGILTDAFRQVIWPHRSARILAPTRFSWLVCVEWWICWFVGGRTACRFR